MNKKIFLNLLVGIILATGFNKEAKALSGDAWFGIIGASVVVIISAIVIYKNKTKISKSIKDFFSLGKSKIEKSNVTPQEKKEASERLDRMGEAIRQSTSSFSNNLSDAGVQNIVGNIVQIISDSTELPKNVIIDGLREESQQQALSNEEQNKLNLSLKAVPASEKENLVNKQITEQEPIRQKIKNISDNIKTEKLKNLALTPEGRTKMEMLTGDLKFNQNELSSMIHQHSTALSNVGVKPEELFDYPHLIQPKIGQGRFVVE